MRASERASGERGAFLVITRALYSAVPEPSSPNSAQEPFTVRYATVAALNHCRQAVSRTASENCRMFTILVNRRERTIGPVADERRRDWREGSYNEERTSKQ